MKDRDDFTEDTKRTIAMRVGYQCCFPGCSILTIGPAIDPEKAMKIGEACHICAASPGGKRYDKLMTPEERKSASNGIWMCRNHHKEIDSDEIEYTAEILRGWKKDAERRAHSQQKGLLISNSNEPLKDNAINSEMMFKKLFEFLYSKRILVYPKEMEIKEWCMDSVLSIKDFIVKCDALNDFDENVIETLIDICNKFLNDVRPLDLPGIIYKANNYQWIDFKFDKAMKAFRKGFKTEISKVEKIYGVNFHKIIPEEY